MSRPFAVDQLSRRGRALIESLYLDGVSINKIPALLREKTGEIVKVSSLHRYYTRRLRSDWRLEAIRGYQLAVVELMRGYSGMSKSKVELAGFLVAILGVQHRLFNDKLEQVLDALDELKKSRGTAKTRRLRAA